MLRKPDGAGGYKWEENFDFGGDKNYGKVYGAVEMSADGDGERELVLLGSRQAFFLDR